MTKREERTKLTVEVPTDLWKRVKIRAVEEDREVWRIVTEALETYLKRRGGK